MMVETAINIFFDKIQNSFSSGMMVNQKYNVGDRLNSLTITYMDDEFDDEFDDDQDAYAMVTFFDCEILEVHADTIYIKYIGYEEDVYNEDGILIEELRDDQPDQEIIYVNEIISNNV
jgi:hypothetical protein